MRSVIFAVAFAAAPDRWFGPDKLKHFFISAFVQSVAYSAVSATGAGRQSSLWGATSVTAVYGVAKEIHDRRSRGEFSGRDLVWDAAGAGAMTLLLRRANR
jgi:putative lipoprotein